MLSGLEVSWLPSYGPEMRGGTAHCHVSLSDTEVDSPLVTRATALFAFNRPSLDRFLSDVTDQGIVIYDSSLIPDPPPLSRVEAIGIPATEIADRLGSARVANLVALGAYLRRTKILTPAAVRAALGNHSLKPAAIALNMKALEEGMRAPA
jgi:Pyruvate/2-oxoacid:ferredoxin oxidoreductase gamma subunit